jgi:glycosyltransferase involved in cell wall biosynthesis
MRVPKVVLVSSYYPPHLGGQEVVVQDLANRLHASNVSVEVVTSDLGSVTGVTIENGVQVTRLKSLEFAHTAVIWNLFFWLIRNVKQDTIVHVHAGQLITPEVVWAASKFGRFSYILHFHSDMKPSGLMGIFLPLYNKIFLTLPMRDASTTIVLREDRSLELMRDYPNNRGVLVMSNGITDDFYEVSRNPGDTTGRLLFVGRLSPHKNVAGLLEAIALTDCKYGVDIVGDGESRKGLEALAAAKNLTNVTFHGRLRRTELHQFYATCSAFILPSFYEQQAMVLLEAMACRVPIIASKVNAVANTFDGSAIVVDPTAEGIASGIEEFARMTAAEIEGMVDRAYKKVKKLSWNTIVKSYIDLYVKMLDDQHPVASSHDESVSARS